jgi:hypothetical protein
MSVAETLSRECPDVATLKEMAAKATGLSDFGDPRLDAPLEAMVSSFQKDAWPKMTPQGRAYALDCLVDWLGGRAKLVADRKRYPEIAQVKVEKPFIVIGPPRSGSTLMHTLLSLDPDAISPQYWQCQEPSPPPKLGPPSAERVDAVNARMGRFLELVPDMQMMHSYLVEEGASALGEDAYDIMIMANTTKGHWYFYPIDSYLEYLLSADHTAALDFHHGFLQHCQWGQSGKHWALKAADHLVWLRELHARYPDAALIWTHRDLAGQLGSAASVFYASRGLSTTVTPDDKASLGRQAAELERRIYHMGMQARDEIGEAPFCDVSYHDMMADPVATVRNIYARYGRELSPAHQQAIEGWVQANPQDKHGVHKHSPADFGIDGDKVNRDFAKYTERFGFGFGIRPPLSV